MVTYFTVFTVYEFLLRTSVVEKKNEFEIIINPKIHVYFFKFIPCRRVLYNFCQYFFFTYTCSEINKKKYVFLKIDYSTTKKY